MVKIALVSCGTEYSGIQKEIEKAANKFGSEIILPEIDLDYIDESYEKFGFSAQSSSLKLMIARAMAILKEDVNLMQYLLQPVLDVQKQH